MLRSAAAAAITLALTMTTSATTASAGTPAAVTGPDSTSVLAARQEPGRPIRRSPAGRTSRLEGAGKAFVLRYTTTSSLGEVVAATGLVLVPESPRPDAGWPLVVYAHMTTGAADICAPTSDEVPAGEDMRLAQQGDDLARALLVAGVVVIRPDYEGLGVPGGHPYLQGPALATSLIDMVAAVRRILPLDGRWVAAGHSEGGVAALHVGDRRRRLVPGMTLRGIASFTPVTRMEVLIQALQPTPVAVPRVTQGLTSLAGLLVKGLAVVDPHFRRLALRRGGLSERALALWPHLERRCLTGLSASDSWGGIAPRDILGPRGEQAAAYLRRELDRIDVRHIPMREVPIRIDEGLLDLVAPVAFTEALVKTYRDRGFLVTHGRWPAGHSPTNSQEQAVPAAVRWMLSLLSSPAKRTQRSSPAYP